jgi:hypothetical protein
MEVMRDGGLFVRLVTFDPISSPTHPFAIIYDLALSHYDAIESVRR